MDSKQTRKISMRSAGNLQESLADERTQKEVGLKRSKIHGWKYEIVNEQRFIIAYLKYEFVFDEIDQLNYVE